jgi:K+-sensing histidine kinase KdpD
MKMSPVDDHDTEFQEVRDRLHLQMMSAVSHDLKTPLASVIGSLEIFNKMRDVLTPEKKEILIQTAIQEAYRLDGFISNILDMAKLENGMVKVTNRFYDIEQIVQESIQKLGDRAKKAHIDIHRPPQPIECETDVALLGRALQCLLDNALKYTAAEAKISIAYEVKDNQVMIHVKDNGPGVAVEDYEKIFCKYTRVSRKDYQNAGTGLGLTLCRSMMKLLGGDVYINKQGANNNGAWFTMVFPYVRF